MNFVFNKDVIYQYGNSIYTSIFIKFILNIYLLNKLGIHLSVIKRNCKLTWSFRLGTVTPVHYIISIFVFYMIFTVKWSTIIFYLITITMKEGHWCITCPCKIIIFGNNVNYCSIFMTSTCRICKYCRIDSMG